MRPERAYVSPAYPDRSVTSVERVKSGSDEGRIIQSINAKDAERVINEALNSSGRNYSSDGRLARADFALPPGSFFEAFA